MHQKVQHEPTILRRRHVEQRTGLSRSTLYQYMKDGAFPSPCSSDCAPWDGSSQTSTSGSRPGSRSAGREGGHNL